ncbi:uncharacterized protein LOC135688555 [Rhopilema esculentum]|uniref:uncharacterized protein LOC135688555 n=1 Tax=Rhopilema esculentum TaxID=499914 RepID=UPI0031DD61DE
MADAIKTNMAEKKEGSNCGRELGLQELFYETMNNRFDTSHYFEYAVLHANYRITDEDLIATLKILVNFQPFLRMKVAGKIESDRPPTRKAPVDDPNTRLYFEPCEVDYKNVLRIRKRTSVDDLEEIVREEEIFLSRPERYGDGPRWRVVFNMPNYVNGRSTKSGDSYRYELFFGMQHQFVDAVSGFDLVYRQLLPILIKVINNMPVDDVFLHPLDLTPTFEEEILGDAQSADKRPAWYTKAGITLLRKVNKVFKSRHFGRPPIVSEGSPFPNEKGMGIFKYYFGESLVERILYERKNHDVTVHSILLTGFSFAMIRLLLDQGLPVAKDIISGWPIDSRKKLPKYKSPQPLGMFVGTTGFTSMKVPRENRLDKDLFWKRARKIARQVLKGVENQHIKMQIDLFAYVTEHLQYEDFLQLFGEIGVNQHFGLSNLGKCSPGPELDANIEKAVEATEIYFGLHGNGSANVGFPFFITVLNHKGKMFFVCCYNKLWVKRDLAEKFLTYAEDILDKVCERASEMQAMDDKIPCKESSRSQKVICK